VLKQPIVLSPQNDEATLTSQEFVLKSRARALLVRHSTDVTNNWLSVNTTLVEKNTGEAYQGRRRSATTRESKTARAGAKDRRDELVPSGVPAGTYYLVIEYELGGDNSGRRRRYASRSYATRAAGPTTCCC
jgi:hypothetical protein